MVPHHGAEAARRHRSWNSPRSSTGSRTTRRRATPASRTPCGRSARMASWRSAPRRRRCWKAFPEAVGSQPTAEEMEARTTSTCRPPVVPKEAAVPSEPVAYPVADFEKNFSTGRAWSPRQEKTADEIIAMVTTKGTLSADQQKRIRDAAKALSRTDFPLEGDQDDAQQQPVHGRTHEDHSPAAGFRPVAGAPPRRATPATRRR